MGYGYGTSGYDTGYDLFSGIGAGLMASLGSALLLGFVAFIAAIVVTVILYKKYLKDPTKVKTPGQKRDWGAFFRFENLIVEKIMQVLYLFTALLIAFDGVANVISALLLIVSSPGLSLILIIVYIIGFFVCEVLNRLWFELVMVLVLIWKNTNELRKHFCGDFFGRPVASSQPAASAAPAQAETASSQSAVASFVQPVAASRIAAASRPTAPVATEPQPAAQQPAAAPAAAAAPKPAAPAAAEAAPEAKAASSWVCPKCGTPNKPGKFCAHCGAKRE